MQNTIYVSKETNTSCSFQTITAALESIPENNQTPITISIAPGTYREKLTINKPYLTLVGEGDSITHGQAIALYADGDRLMIDSCRLLGHQDTLFTAPLPPKEVEPRGFIGPKEFAPRITGRQYYRNCYICGDIDFIFGGGTAYFEDCTIESLRRFSEKDNTLSDATQGYVTAASTPEGQKYGYVFSRCNLISADCPAGTVYLGRPWREFAKTVFIDCTLGAHIHPEGFHDWNKTAARETIFYAEYSKTPCPNRADFVKKLGESELTDYTKAAVLSGDDNWLPD